MLHVEEVLLLLLASDGGGEGCRDLASQLLILGQKRQKRLVNLGLVVLVDPWQGEDADPGEGNQGQASHQSAQVAHPVHAQRKLCRLDNVLNKDDGLEGGEQSVDPSAGVLDCARQLGLGDPDVNVQECLVGKSSNRSYIQNCETLYIFATANDCSKSCNFCALSFPMKL